MSQRKNPVPGGAGYSDTPRANSVNTAAPGTGSSPMAALGLDCLANDRRETWDIFPCGRVRIIYHGM